MPTSKRILTVASVLHTIVRSFAPAALLLRMTSPERVVVFNHSWQSATACATTRFRTFVKNCATRNFPVDPVFEL